jgi:hypothetical protein
MIVSEWAAILEGATPILTWQNKIRHLRRFIKGWAKNMSSTYKNEKERFLKIIDELDIKSKTQDYQIWKEILCGTLSCI